MYKISGQQLLNPKVGSVGNSCDNNETSKMAKIVYRQMLGPWNLYQKVPPAKIRMQKPQSGSKFSVQILWAGRGDCYGKNW